MGNWVMVLDYDEAEVRLWAESLDIILGERVPNYQAIELINIPEDIEWCNFGEYGESAWLKKDGKQVGHVIYHNSVSSTDQSYTIDPVMSYGLRSGM